MTPKLGRSDVESYLEIPGLGEHLSAADLGKLRSLLPRIDPSGEIVLADALDALYPGVPRKTALAYLRQLRSRLRHATDEAGVELVLHVGGGTRTAPEDRACWFTGPSRALQRVSAFSEAGTALRDPRKEPIPLQARVLRGEGVEAEDPRRLVRIFISYAHENRGLKEKLVKLLRARLANARDFRFKIWDDPKILPGEGWEDEIRAEIEACDLGLLLFSHEFLASDFIREKELPYFVSADDSTKPSKLALPVGLAHVDLDDKRFRLHGIESKQIFRSKDRSFEDCAQARDRSHFASQLSRQILDFVEKHLPPVAAREASAPPLTAAAPPCEAHEDLAAQIEGRLRPWVYGIGGDPEHFVPTRAVQARLDKQTAGEKPTTSGDQVDALEFLLTWATDPSEPPFCALLGEYGMGKTTTCEALTRRLLETQSADPTVPTPIYLDLRYVGDLARQNPLLEEILRLVSARTHATGHPGEEAPSAAEIMELVQSGKAVAIFDGLDEVLVHLTAPQGQSFTRELWRILPPRRLPPRKHEESGVVKPQAEAIPSHPSGKLLISCRTHYFRTLREERNHFLGQDREAISPSDYRALVLLPFTTEQIEEYLEKNLPGQEIEKLLDLIRSIHNLGELAGRPYTLKLIAEHIPKLEKWKLEGRKVTGVTLYREMVDSWLERDVGKHTLTRDHKIRLMERLAAELWASGKRAWSAEDIEQWLIDFLGENPRIESHYTGKDRELLKEDLRTATFLVRDGEDDGFRFAHTSLQEFFLAAHLHRALLENRFEAWQIPRPSPETLDFLGQLIAEKDETGALTAFRKLRGVYRPQASELMLAYALRAKEKGHPAPALAGFRLDGAQLKDWTIAAPEGSSLLDLQGASFRDANLDGARLYRINGSAVDFGGADLTCAEWIGGKGRGARFGKTVLVGTVFRDLDLGGSDFSDAKLHRSQWLRCELKGSSGLDSATSGLFAECEPEIRSFRLSRPLARLAALPGHSGSVFACAFSPDGSLLASAGDDGALRIWDASTGEALQVLEGHEGSIESCVFSTDGSRLASAGDGGALRIWDTASGETLRVLEGHRDSVRSCAFSPDGSRLASAGDYGSLRLWGVVSGEVVQILEGHVGSVLSCAFSPDGSRLASAGVDGTLRIWDVNSGEAFVVLEALPGFVRSCAFSFDGARLASAGNDGFLRLWDADTGEAIRVLEGHRAAVLFCAFSPDGSRLASAGDDGSLRIWDAATGDPLRVLEGHLFFSCAFSPDGSRLASAGYNSSLRIWETATGVTLRVLEGGQDWVRSCAFSPDGSWLSTAGDSGSLRIWETTTGEPLRVLEGNQGYVWSCAFSPNGFRLASAGENVRIWDTATGEPLRVLEENRGQVFSCAFSPDGSQLASAGENGSLRLWDAEIGEALRFFEGHRSSVWSSVFSPDGSQLASAGGDGTLRLWDTATGEPLRVLGGHRGGVWSCAFSPDGSWLASAGDDGALRLWDATNGELHRVFEGHQGWVRSCTFSPDGKRLVSAGDDGTVRVWEATTGEALRVLEGHRVGVKSCAFSPDGKRLASAGSDGTVRAWEVATGQETGRIQFLPGAEFAVFFGPGLELSYASPGAWRWLGWLAPDPVTGVMTRYPAEIFGPLPGPDEKGGFRER